MEESFQAAETLQLSRVVVRIWDLDETLIIFQSLIEGTFVHKLNGSRPGASPRATAAAQHAVALGKATIGNLFDSRVLL